MVSLFLTSFGSNCYGLTLTMNRAEGHSLAQQLHLTSKILQQHWRYIMLVILYLMSQ